MIKFNVTANRNGVVTVVKGVEALNMLAAISSVKRPSDYWGGCWFFAREVK